LFLESNVIALPWSSVGNLNQFSTQQEVKQAFSSCYPDISAGASVGYASQLFRFFNDIKKGDRVIYPVKRSTQLFVGVITGDYMFIPGQKNDWSHQHAVNWQSEIDKTKLPKEILQRIGTPAQFSTARLRGCELTLLNAL